MTIDDIKLFLPKYLSPESYTDLIQCLRDFPNPTSRFYTKQLDDQNIIFQGDGLPDLPVVHFEVNDNISSQRKPCIVLSNTCDMDLKNPRIYSTQIVYAPIFNLNIYKQSLYSSGKFPPNKIQGHIEAIKLQGYTQIIYLPACEGMEESFVFLDRMNNYPNAKIDREDISKKRFFCLDNYGFYLLVFKLSVHFCRMNERIDRNTFFDNHDVDQPLYE